MANELLDEFNDSEVMTGDDFRVVIKILKEEPEAWDSTLLKQAMRRYIRNLEEHLIAFQALQDHNERSKTLRMKVIEFLEWKCAEVPRMVMAAREVGGGQSPDPGLYSKTVATLVSRYVEEESRRLQNLSAVSREILLVEGRMAASKGDSAGPFFPVGWAIAAFFVSVAGVAGATWFIVRVRTGTGF